MKTVATPGARWALFCAIAFWFWVSLSPNPRPDPTPANAPAQVFSAERAMAHVAAIAQKPHPSQSAEWVRVRDYLRGELSKFGVEPQIQTGIGTYLTKRRGRMSGPVENIVARLKGSANTRPIMLAAHYDSSPNGPGAADDAHGVAVLLETLRALHSGPPLRNDVIFLMTDGEERGLLGADVFMREHPWSHDPAVALNFEARGTGGPS
jgi:acetylornithine deacetylase/succinyl-diaminopimelate desuccinylase-like protein